MSTAIKKHNWKRTGLIIGIIFVIIIGVIITFKVYKNIKDKIILKKEQDKNLNTGGGGNSSGGNNSNPNTGSPTGTTTTTTQPAASGTPFNKLKVGDKLWSIGITNLYKSAALGASNLVLVVPDANYVGQITEVTTGGRLKVKLYSYTGGNLGYDFYAPAKSYIVK